MYKAQQTQTRLDVHKLGRLAVAIFSENLYDKREIKERTVGKLIERGFIKEEDILFVHLGYEKYANVIFTKPIYEARKKVRDYLTSVGIETIGRFGEWDYLWSDQSLVSGLSIRNNNGN